GEKEVWLCGVAATAILELVHCGCIDLSCDTDKSALVELARPIVSVCESDGGWPGFFSTAAPVKGEMVGKHVNEEEEEEEGEGDDEEELKSRRRRKRKQKEDDMMAVMTDRQREEFRMKKRNKTTRRLEKLIRSHQFLLVPSTIAHTISAFYMSPQTANVFSSL
ncbi:hypothetical protein ADUPG1_005433, partial [Aduncisulcus paluster]